MEISTKKTARKGKAAVKPTKPVVVEEPTTDPESPVSSGSEEIIPVIKKVIKKKIIRKKVVKKQPAPATKSTAKSKKTDKSSKKLPQPTSDEEDKSQESQESQEEVSHEEPETQESVNPEVSSQESEVEKSPEKPKRKATKAPKSKLISPIKKQKSTVQSRRMNVAEPDTLESSGTKSPGPKVSEQDSLSIHVPNHTMNDPSITMNEMVFNAIKKELSENGKDTFTYQSIEKRMKIEGSDTVRKCIKALLEEGVLENKKKSKKFIGKMQGQLELMKGNYYEVVERTTEQLIHDVVPENHLEETFTVQDLNDEVPKASSTAKKPPRADVLKAALKTKTVSSKKVAAIEPKKIEEKPSFSDDNDSETNDEQVSIPIVMPPTPPRKKVVKKAKVDAAKNKRRRSRSIVLSKTSKKLPTKKLEKEKKVEKKVAKARRPGRARKQVVEESDQ